MKKLFVLFSFLVASLAVVGQEKALTGYLSYATFDVPGGQPYVETYLAVEASSVVFAQISGSAYQASVGVTFIFMQEDSVRSYAKYELKSPIVADPAKALFGIVDQQRFSLPDGTYTLSVELTDLNNPTAIPFVAKEEIVLSFDRDSVQLSAIQLIESYRPTQTESVITKNGFDLIPLVYAYYPATDSVLHYYAEVYNSAKVFGEGNKFLLTYFIESFENQSKMGDYIYRRRTESRPVNVLLNSIDITNLPSGNYNLVVEVRDQQNHLVAQNRVFFQRSNPKVQYNLKDIASVNVEATFMGKINNMDTLIMMLRCIAPISTEADRDYAANLSKTTDKKTMQQFLFNFWQKRNAADPRQAWLNYYEEVKKVNASFKALNFQGYETDRGRVYLQYGPPNHIVEAYNEPSGYPYEIWHYYTLGTQRNKRFVFVTKNLVTNYFVLVHSDAIGELANYRWEYDVYGRANTTESVDETHTGDHFGNRAFDFYRNPR